MNQSVMKAIRLLDLFTEEDQELSLKQIADNARMPKPTAYRLLSSLEQAGMLEKIKESEHDSRYRLGLKLLELGHLVAGQLEIRQVALPLMEQLAHHINEVIHLVIVNQDEAVYIEKVDSTRAIRLHTRIGKRSPLYLGSGPKLLLAHLPQDRQEHILSARQLAQPANGSNLTAPLLKAELRKIREEGYAFSEGEQDVETTGISYPIYDYESGVAAALAVSGLSSHFEGENLERIKEAVRDTADRISTRLGFRNMNILEGVRET